MSARERAAQLDAAVASTLERLEERSRRERAELAELNARGARHVREAASRFLLDVGPDVGALLSALARTACATRIIEVGGSSGYSTIWLAEAARAAGGRVTTIEIDPVKCRELRENVRDAGLGDVVEIIEDDAHAYLARAEPPIDLVLIDHWKDAYVRAFDLVWPKMVPRGLVVADNILRPEATRDAMEAYRRHVVSAPSARSYTLDIGDGIEITMRGAST